LTNHSCFSQLGVVSEEQRHSLLISEINLNDRSFQALYSLLLFSITVKEIFRRKQNGSVQVVDMEKEENVVILDVETVQGET
jgi:hypothetical protein